MDESIQKTQDQLALWIWILLFGAVLQIGLIAHRLVLTQLSPPDRSPAVEAERIETVPLLSTTASTSTETKSAAPVSTPEVTTPPARSEWAALSFAGIRMTYLHLDFSQPATPAAIAAMTSAVAQLTQTQPVGDLLLVGPPTSAATREALKAELINQGIPIRGVIRLRKQTGLLGSLPGILAQEIATQ